jgi:uncharacterized membrane protein YhdT
MSKHKQDRRFKIAHREALIGLALAFINFIWWYGFAYGLGSQPVEDYTYIFGLPAWFFYSCIVGFGVIVIILTILVYTVFQDVPLEDEEGDNTR